MTHPAIRKNATAVITGGASGIGLAAAKSFAEGGLNLVLADLNAEHLDAARKEISAFGAKVLTVQTDVSDLAQVQELKATAYDKFGSVDILMNNAGTAPAADHSTTTRAGSACSGSTSGA